MIKTCSKCKTELDISEFNVKQVYPNGSKRYQTFCKKCNKIYSHEWYKNNSTRIIDRNRENRSKYVDWFNDYKKTLACACGETHPSCLDFHHIDPKTKKFEISGSIRRYGKDVLMKEISKCIVLCANCHRKLHWDEKNKK